MDAAELRRRVSLVGVVEAALGKPRRSGAWLKWRCPFHDDHNPSFAIGPDRLRFKCFACNVSGDVIDWFEKYEKLTFLEAKARVAALAGERAAGISSRSGGDRGADRCQTGGDRGANRRENLVDVKPPDPPGERWQAMAWEFIAKAQAQLWGGEEGAEIARPYLYQDRFLTDATIRAAGLGWCPGAQMDGRAWGLDQRTMFLYRGLVIPLIYGSDIWGVKARCFSGRTPRVEGGHKYRHIKGGGDVWPYGLGECVGRDVLLVCEGEFDAMLARQELGDSADVVAMKVPKPYWLPVLLEYRAVLAAYDRDRAGARFGQSVVDVLPQACRVRVPVQESKADLTDFYAIGGDLGAWFDVQARRCRRGTG